MTALSDEDFVDNLSEFIITTFCIFMCLIVIYVGPNIQFMPKTVDTVAIDMEVIDLYTTVEDSTTLYFVEIGIDNKEYDFSISYNTYKSLREGTTIYAPLSIDGRTGEIKGVKFYQKKLINK